MMNKMEVEKPKAEAQVATKRHQGSKSSPHVALPEDGNEKCQIYTVSPAVASPQQVVSAPVCHSDDGFQLQRRRRRKEKRLIRGTAKHVDSKVKGGGPCASPCSCLGLINL